MKSQFSRRSVVRGMTALASSAVFPSFGVAADVTWTMPAERQFKMVENTWIAMRDGVKLAARLWLPDGSDKTPVGAVLEYIPYRTGDLNRAEDDAWGTALASHGFAYARVDVRGSGNSGGLCADEYEPIQQDDAVEVIAWLAAQSWCNGAVGMRGYSWGGNSTLQAATRNPPALKAIIACCPSGDRYRLDAHWVGGDLALANFQWGSWFKTVMTGPPDPEIFGPTWKDEWMKRLDAAPPTVTTWVEHQHVDDYWATGSAKVDYAKIACPVYALSGQVDCYTNTVIEVLEGLTVPRKGLIGAWGHFFPQNGQPGPQVDWLREELRWWTQWLSRIETGIMSGPMLQTYVDFVSPVQVTPADVPGVWISEASWPAPAVTPHAYFLQAGRLASDTPPPEAYPIPNEHVVGLATREFLPFNMLEDLPRNQKEDDGFSLCFDTPVLEQALWIVGRPKLSVSVRSDQPVATLVARLNEVDADGSSWPIVYGLFNLTHRKGDTSPEALTPGTDYVVEIPFKYCARKLQPGSRLRIALSQTMWPLVVSTPKPTKLSITTGAATKLTVPVHSGDPVQSDPGSRPTPAAAEGSDPGPKFVTESVERGGLVRIERKTPLSPAPIPGSQTVSSYGDHVVLEIDERKPHDSYWSVDLDQGISRGSWNTLVNARTELWADEKTFRVRETLVASNNDVQIFKRVTERTMQRDLC